MAEHRNLTGASLHEPKGVEGAPNNTVYHSNGAGSGSWIDPLARVKDLNSFELTGSIDDISASNSNVFFRVPRNCVLLEVSCTLYTTINTADSVISIYKNNILQPQTLTVAHSGSGAGVTSTRTLSPTYTFVKGDLLEFRSDGASDVTSKAAILALFEAM